MMTHGQGQGGEWNVFESFSLISKPAVVNSSVNNTRISLGLPGERNSLSHKFSPFPKKDKSRIKAPNDDDSSTARTDSYVQAQNDDDEVYTASAKARETPRTATVISPEFKLHPRGSDENVNLLSETSFASDAAFLNRAQNGLTLSKPVMVWCDGMYWGTFVTSQPFPTLEQTGQPAIIKQLVNDSLAEVFQASKNREAKMVSTQATLSVSDGGIVRADITTAKSQKKLFKKQVLRRRGSSTPTELFSIEAGGDLLHYQFNLPLYLGSKRRPCLVLLMRTPGTLTISGHCFHITDPMPATRLRQAIRNAQEAALKKAKTVRNKKTPPVRMVSAPMTNSTSIRLNSNEDSVRRQSLC